MLDEAERRFFIQRKILLQQPVDAVSLYVRVGAYDDAIILRHATPDFRDGVLLALIRDRLDLPRIWDHRIKNGLPAFVLPFLIVGRHEVRADMTGKRHKINLSDLLFHFLLMIFIASLHVTHEARFFRDK